MEDLRSWWEVPSIAHFCSLFRAAFDLSDFDIEDLEEGLLESEKEGGCEFLTELVCKLLNGCYGREDICSFNYDLYIKDIIKYKWDSTDSPILKKSTFHELTLREKVEVIHSICEYRLDGEDVMELLKGFDGDSMRVEPLGKDKEGGLYWYFYGSRLYKEDPEPKKELTKEQKRREEREKRKERRKEQQRKKKLEKEQRKQEKVQRRLVRRVEKKKLLEMRKREQEEEAQGKRRRSGRIQKIQEQQLMESSESSSESSSSEEESEVEESSSEEVSEEEEASNSDTEVEEQPAVEDKTPKKENKKETPSKAKKTTEKPTPIPVEKKAGKRQPPPRKKQESKSKREEERPENSRRSGRLKQKTTRSQIEDRQSDSGIDDSDKNSSDTDDDTKSVRSEISRRSTKSEISTRSDSVKKERPKRSTRSDKKQSKLTEKDKPNTSKTTADSESKTVRGRGRPRKAVEPEDADKDKNCDENDAENESDLEKQSEKDAEKPKGRGRPRKTGNHEQDKKKICKANNLENESEHKNKSEKSKGRGRHRKSVDHDEKNSKDNHEEDESDSETKSEKDSEKLRRRGGPRQNARLSKAPEGTPEKDSHEDNNCEENHIDNENDEEKPETVMTRRRRLRCSTESNSNSNKEDSEKNNVDKNVEPEIKIEKPEVCEESGEEKEEAGTMTEVKLETETEHEKGMSKDCDTNSTHETSDKDTVNTEMLDSKDVEKDTVNEDGKTSDEKDFSEAKTKIKSENELVKDEQDCDTAEVKEERKPDGEENKENTPKTEEADTGEMEDATEEETKLTPVQSPEATSRPKPTPPPKSKTESRWHLICTTLDDWINLAEWFKESTVRCEKALSKVIEEDFLPVLPEIIETREKEKLRRQRENEQRKSARITQKQREKMEQEKILAEAFAAEEQARKEAEEERRVKEEQERLEHENRLREERVKAREERAKRLSMREERARLVAEGKEIPPELIYTGLPAQRYKDDFDSDDSKPDFLDDESFQSLLKVIDGMKNHKDCWPFLEPVTEEQAPGYHDVIKRPMDLSKIEKKVELREYRTQHHFLSDFRLMFNNCRRFNGPDSDFTACSKTMEKHLKNLVKKHLLEQPTDSYYDDEDFVSSMPRGSQGEKKIRPKRQAGTKALQTVQKALKEDDQSSSEEEEELQTEPVKRRKIPTDEAISPSVRSLLLQEMIEFKRKRAEQRTSGQLQTQKPPTTQGIMIMPREEIPTDGVLRLAASREIRWKIDPKNVSLKPGLNERGYSSTIIKAPETNAQQRIGRPPLNSVGQSPNLNPAGLAANSSPAVRPQSTLNVVHKKAVGLAPGQKIIKILASAPGTGIHAVRQTAESVKVSSDGYLILNGKPTSIKVTPNTKIVIQPQASEEASQGSGSEGSGPAIGSPLGKEVIIKKIPTPAGLQPLADMESSVSLQPIHQGFNEHVPAMGSIPQRQNAPNHSQFNNVTLGQGQPTARMATGNQQQGMAPGRVTVQTPRVVNVTGQHGTVPSSGTNPNQVMAPDPVEARKQQFDIAQRLLAAKRRQLMQNGPISPKVARLEKDSSPLISSPNIAISGQGKVLNSNVERVNSLSSNVLQNVNISNDILDSYYSVMNEGSVQKTGESTAQFAAVPLTSIQQSPVQGTSVTNVLQGGTVPSSHARNVAVPQHTPVNINRLLHSSPPPNTVSATPVTLSNSEIIDSDSQGVKTMSLSALTTALARSIAAGNVQLNRTTPKAPARQLSSGHNSNRVNQNQLTSQTRTILPVSDSVNSVVINMDPQGSITQQYLQVSQPVQTVNQSPQLIGQTLQNMNQPIQTVNQSPQLIGQTSQIVNQPLLQKSPNVSSAISELLKSTVIKNSVSNLLTTDSVGLQNQIISNLTNVQTQVQTLASVLQPVSNLTSVQNQSLASQSQVKPIEAPFTGQTTPVILSPTKSLAGPNLAQQFSPYKPSVNISPPKSDRPNLFDVFESGKDKTVLSPKSDDFGFASLADNKSDKIPLPVRQTPNHDVSMRVMKTTGKEFVGSPLNTSVMEALKSKLSPGKVLTGPQPIPVQTVVSRETEKGTLLATPQASEDISLCVEDPIPCSDTVVASSNKTSPAQDNPVAPNPVVPDYISTNPIVTNNSLEVQIVSKCSKVEDQDASECIKVEDNSDATECMRVADNNPSDMILEPKDTTDCINAGATDTTKCMTVAAENITVIKMEPKDTTGCIEVGATDTTKCMKVAAENITVIKMETIDTTEYTQVEAEDTTECIEVAVNNATDVELEPTYDTKEAIEAEAADTTEGMEVSAENITVIKMEPIDTTEYAQVDAKDTTESIEIAVNNTTYVELEPMYNTKEAIGAEATEVTEVMEVSASKTPYMKLDVNDTTESTEASDSSKSMNEDRHNTSECLKVETNDPSKCMEVCAQDADKCLEVQTQEFTNCCEEEGHVENILKVELEDSDSKVADVHGTKHQSKDINSADVERHGWKPDIKIDINDFLFKTKPQIMESYNVKRAVETIIFAESDLESPVSDLQLKHVAQLMETDTDKVKSLEERDGVQLDLKSTIQNEAKPTVLDIGSPKLYMTKNQEPAMVLTVKEEIVSVPENLLRSSLEEQLEVENKDSIQSQACVKNEISPEDANLEEYLSTGMLFSSRVKKNAYTVYNFACKTENDLSDATVKSEQNSWNEGKTYGRKIVRKPKAKLEQPASFDQHYTCKSCQEKLGSNHNITDAQFEEEFYRSLLCRQKAADSSFIETDISINKPLPAHKQHERYLGLTVSGSDLENYDEIVKDDIKFCDSKTEIESSPKKTRILIKTKFDDGKSLKRQVWRLKSPDDSGKKDKYEQTNQEPAQVWRLKSPEDSGKKDEYKQTSQEPAQVWRLKSPEDLGKKDEYEQTSQEPAPVWRLKSSEDSGKKDKYEQTSQEPAVTCSTKNYMRLPLQENIESILQNFKFSKSLLRRKYNPCKRKPILKSTKPTGQSLSDSKMSSEDIGELVSAKKPHSAPPAKTKSKKFPEKLSPLRCKSRPKLYKLRGVSSDSAISVTSGLDNEEVELTSERVRSKLKRLQHHPDNETPTQEWKLKAVHSDSMVDYALVRTTEENMLNAQEKETLMGDDAMNKIYRTIPYSRNLSAHERMKRHTKVIVKNRPLEFTGRRYRSLLDPSFLYKCKKSLSFPDSRSFGDSISNTHELASYPLLNDTHVNVVCSTPSPSFINHFVGGGDVSDVTHNVHEISGDSLTLDEHFFMDNLNLLPELTEDPEFNRIENDIFELQEQYLKPVDQTITSPLPMFGTIAPKLVFQDQTQGNYVNKQVVIGTLPDSLRQTQNVSVSIAEETPGNWQQNSQTLGNVQSKVVVQSLPHVQSLLGRPDNLSAIESNVNSRSTSLPVSSQAKTIESIFASNVTDTSATGSIANLLAKSLGHQTLLNNATYVGSINIPGSSESQGVNDLGQSAAHNNEKLSALEAMFLKGIQGVQQTVVSPTPTVTVPSEGSVTAEKGDGSVPEFEFTAEKLEQT